MTTGRSPAVGGGPVSLPVFFRFEDQKVELFWELRETTKPGDVLSHDQFRCRG